MIRIATFLAAAAIAASSLTSSASAQSFTGDADTGNVQDTHFKGRSRIRDFAKFPVKFPVSRQNGQSRAPSALPRQPVSPVSSYT